MGNDLLDLPSTEDIEIAGREARTERAKRFPPRPEFVGKIVGVRVERTTSSYDGKPRENRFMIIDIDPLNTVSPFIDGHFSTRWKVSVNPRSIYAVVRGLLDQALRDVHGNPTYILRDPNDLIGLTMVWKEMGSSDPIWNPLGAYKPQNHVMIPVGAAPTGWESTVPANFSTLKLEALAIASERARDRAAQNGSTSFTQATVLSAEPVEFTLTAEQTARALKFLDGKAERGQDLFLDAMNDAEIRQDMVLLNGIPGRQVQTHLINIGLLTKSASGVYTRV